MIDSLSKALFHSLAGNQTLQRISSRYGMRSAESFARRFIAGETVDDAIAAARTIEADGKTQTLDYLGESVGSIAAADQATRAYLTVIEAIARAGIGRNISLKLTQLGLTVDRATCVDNLRRILDASGTHRFFVRIDMENSPYTQVTLDVFETIWQQGYRSGRPGAAGEGGLQGTARRRISRQSQRGRSIRGHHESTVDGWHLPGHRHPRSGDDCRDP
jgi:proline dehydrogenase